MLVFFEDLSHHISVYFDLLLQRLQEKDSFFLIERIYAHRKYPQAFFDLVIQIFSLLYGMMHLWDGVSDNLFYFVHFFIVFEERFVGKRKLLEVYTDRFLWELLLQGAFVFLNMNQLLIMVHNL